MSGWNTILRALGASAMALALCAPLAACKTPLDRAWGVSQHAHTAQMIEDPEAGLRNRDVAHPDGKSTDVATTKWRKEEAKTGASKPQTVVNVNSGGK